MKTRVLYIAGILSSYNDPIYQLISDKVNLTYAWVNKTEVKNPKYKTFQFPSLTLGPFTFHKHLHRIINQYDVVIFSPHLSFPRTCLMPFFPHKPKVISWDIGLHVTYSKKYDLAKNPDFKDRVFQAIQNHCDACIFYMPQPIEYWKKHSHIDERKYFVAHNTVKVADFDNLPDVSERNKFLFVGTLYRQKGLGELIEAYVSAKNKCEDLYKLYIVGKGPEEQLIKAQIQEQGLSDSVVMTGAIYEEEVLKDYFLTSLLCISPKQAGLSVQKSLGYGVPFVTRPDAITGGERLDVHDGENGFFYNTVEELANIMVKAVKKPDIIERMSMNARHYYLSEASPEKMAQGALDAIEYVMNQK
ncbi:MAG: glycosyltransferase [Bacteroidaceae bacterium]|nr:glycosyltransferase [Bacteroidaceae bacterium]